MHLRNPEHQDIFYPSDPKTAGDLCDPRKSRKEDLPVNCLAARLPAALMAPHAAWQWILPQLRQAMATAAALAPRQIVLLGPVHQQVILQDEPKIAFMPSQDGAETPVGNMLFATASRDALTTGFSKTIDIQDCYFTEEPCMEIFYPLLAANFPQVPVLPILASKECSSAQCKNLAAILQALFQKEPQTLFIVTANMSEETTRPRAREQAGNLQELLGQGHPLLEARTQGRINGCGLQWLEALERLTWQSSGWMMLSCTNDGENFYTEIPSQDITTDDKRHVVWHGVALHR